MTLLPRKVYIIASANLTMGNPLWKRSCSMFLMGKVSINGNFYCQIRWLEGIWIRISSWTAPPRPVSISGLLGHPNGRATGTNWWTAHYLRATPRRFNHALASSMALQIWFSESVVPPEARNVVKPFESKRHRKKLAVLFTPRFAICAVQHSVSLW